MQPGEPVRRWRIGDVTVTRVSEAVLESILDEASDSEGFLGLATTCLLRSLDGLAPDFVTPEGALRLAFQSFVIDTGTCRIVVDTCVGNDKHRPHHGFWDMLGLPYLESLKAAGYRRETIDVVVCTHLHVDHVGWNTMWDDGRWVPTFPKAAYLFGRDEFEYWQSVSTAGGEGPFHPDVFMADSVQPVIDAGLVTLVDSDHGITAEVTLFPTSGHTPGHVSILIASKGEEAVITGDVIHHPVQVAHPDWGVAADHDHEVACSTRRALIAQAADTPRLVIGSHWAGRASGHVVSTASGYRLR